MDFIPLLDKGIDPGFVASLAGLSLAAAAFYAPAASDTIRQTEERIAELETRVAMGAERGIHGETDYNKELDRLRELSAATRSAQRGLIKAFLVLVILVGYTISFDQLVSADSLAYFSETFGAAAGPLLQAGDLAASTLLLSIAGANLWIGARSIGRSFDVRFDEERKRLDNFARTVRTWAQTREND